MGSCLSITVFWWKPLRHVTAEAKKWLQRKSHETARNEIRTSQSQDWLQVLLVKAYCTTICRLYTMQKTYMWMEDSLQRTSELGRQVLERAQRRDVDWWSAQTHSGQSPRIHPESPEEERPPSLEEAFSTLSRFMRHTTEQCERYHSCIPAQKMNRSEIQHVSRFHCWKLQQSSPRPSPPYLSSATAPLQSSGRRRLPQDVNIEVAPGTYSISAGAPHCQRQTHLVHITPGQSVDLTFNV